MGKYYINENPENSAVPIIDTESGPNGKRNWIGIYNDHSVIHYEDNTGNRRTINLFFSTYFQHKKIVNFNEKELNKASEMLKLPIDELKEIKKLDKEYRESKNI